MQTENQIFNDFGGKPVKFKPAETIDKRAARWLFYPLQIISVRRKQEFRRFRLGGDELELTTNVLYKGFLPKCGLVPLTMAPKFIPPEFARENFEELQVDAPAHDPDEWKGIPMASSFGGSHLVGVAEYPHHDILTVLTLNNDRGILRGIREIASLRNIDFDPELTPALQRFFFPNFFGEQSGPRTPETLREVEEFVQAAVRRYRNGDRVAEFDCAHIGGEMLESCDQARSWANIKIDLDHAMMQVGGSEYGKTDGYSDLVIELLPQLEVQRQDQHLRNEAANTAANAENLGALTELMRTYIEGQVMGNAAASGPGNVTQADVTDWVRQAMADIVAKPEIVTETDQTKIDMRTKAGRELKEKQEQEKTAADPSANDE